MYNNTIIGDYHALSNTLMNLQKIQVTRIKRKNNNNNNNNRGEIIYN